MRLLGALASTRRSAVARKSKVPQGKMWGAGDEGAVVAHERRCYVAGIINLLLVEGLGRAVKSQTFAGFEYAWGSTSGVNAREQGVKCSTVCIHTYMSSVFLQGCYTDHTRPTNIIQTPSF